MSQEKARLISTCANQTGKQSVSNPKWECIREIAEYLKALDERDYSGRGKMAMALCTEFELPRADKTLRELGNTYGAYIAWCRRWSADQFEQLHRIIVCWTDAVRDTETDANTITESVCVRSLPCQTMPFAESRTPQFHLHKAWWKSSLSLCR